MSLKWPGGGRGSSQCCCKPCDPCCPSGYQLSDCCCYFQCVPILMTYLGSTTSLGKGGAGNCSPCVWQNANYSLTWCYSNNTWTLRTSGGATLGTATGACGFPVSITTGSGTATIFTPCGWSALPTTASVVISGIPSTFFFSTACPSAAAYYTGTDALNGTYVCDLNAFTFCHWGFSEPIVLETCDRPGPPTLPCPYPLCTNFSCTFSIDVSLVYFSGAQLRLSATFTLLDPSGGLIFTCSGNSLVTVSGTCSWPVSLSMPACVPPANRFGFFTTPTVQVTL